jgi:hypothetical protein
MFRDEDAEFLLAILGQRPLTCTIDEACKSLRAVAQVYQIPEKYLQ